MELEQFKQILVDTQPYAVTDHSKISLEIYEGWADATAPKSLGDVIDAYATTKTKRFQLTTGALLSLASTLQIGADAVFATPPELLTPMLNWWFDAIPDEDSPAFTLSKNDVATAVVRPQGELPEFPTFYVDAIAEAMKVGLGSEKFYVHPWYLSSPKETFCVVYSDAGAHIVGSDTWYTGIVFKMSSAGLIVPSLSLAFVRPRDNAVVIPPKLDYRYAKRKHGAGRTNTQTWVEDSVSFLCSISGEEARVLESLVSYDASEHVGAIVSDIMREVSLPRQVLSHVLDAVVENDGDTGYDLLDSVLSGLDFTDESVYDDKINERVMRAAGRLWQVLESRCETCHQMYH